MQDVNQATRHDFFGHTSWSGESVDAHDKTNTARLSGAFRDLDRDGDGVLSLAEFTPLAKTMGADGDEAVQEMFDELDTDSNGVISEGEFLAFFRHAFGSDDLDGLGDEAQWGMQRLLQMLHMLKEKYGCKQPRASGSRGRGGEAAHTMSMPEGSESNAIERIMALKLIQRRTGAVLPPPCLAPGPRRCARALLASRLACAGLWATDSKVRRRDAGVAPNEPR
jgi:hypothetical protein